MGKAAQRRAYVWRLGFVFRAGFAAPWDALADGTRHAILPMLADLCVHNRERDRTWIMSDSPVRLDPKTIPAEIDRWNWGAFLLNWIWGIGNNTYIALLALIPGVSFIMLFVLGAKGSAWFACLLLGVMVAQGPKRRRAGLSGHRRLTRTLFARADLRRCPAADSLHLFGYRLQ